MKNWLGRLFRNKIVFVVVNTVFWLGLAALLLTDDGRLYIGGALMALLLGGYLLYFAFSPKLARGLAEPGRARWVSGFFGLVAIAFGLLMLVYVAQNGVPTAPRPASEQLVDTGGSGGLDWPSIAVISFTFVLPLVLSWGVNWWWTRRERAQQQAALPEGTVFAIPPLLRSPTLFVVFALLALSLFVFIAGLNGERTGLTMEAGIGIPLLFAPLIVGGVLFLLHNSGMVLLTAEGIHLRRPGRRHCLLYSDITGLQSRTNPFAAGLLIQGAGRTLRIPRTLKNFPHLYQLLVSRVAPAVQDETLGWAARPRIVAGASDGPIFTLSINRRIWALYIMGILLFILLYLGLSLMGLWMGLAQGEGPPFSKDWLTSTLIFFLLISVFFVPALIFVIRSLVTKYGPFKIEQPIAWEFYREKIRYRLPRDEWQTRPGKDLQRVELKPLPSRVRVRGGGAIISQRMTRYMLVIEFVDDTRLVIDQERAVQFGETTERLHAQLSQLYHIGKNPRVM